MLCLLTRPFTWVLLGCAFSDGSADGEETERMAASAEEELEQLQHLNLGGLDSRDGVLDEVRGHRLPGVQHHDQISLRDLLSHG